MSNYNSINDYLEAKERWEFEPITIVDGGYRVNGETISPAEYYNANPKPTYIPPQKDNSDGTNIFKGVITGRK